jgi:hypothetical protein
MQGRMRLLLLAIGITIYVGATCANAAGFARLTFHSDPGNPIGLGADVDITYPAQTAHAFISIPSWQFDPAALNIVQFVVANVQDPTIDSVFLTFNTYPNQVVPGFYSLMTQGTTIGQPYNDFGITFRNTTCGSDPASNFNVEEVQFGNDKFGEPTVLKFRASFVFYCFRTTDALHGTFVFDATDNPTPPASVPLSALPLVLVLAILGSVSAARRR